ncbi:NAD-dependent epimerase/dehydratase family protein [Shinella sumterensis]|uniref:NAD-dependent epimerase/dehydratase family protein n=1 Tax=Shinella sumterensis TaxID=1967501 RepID=A0AA50H394_9HYPH|nr:NAD-dependent epimerase/dehydratase family protein [Shinella sumterensis]WLR96179.1 NAD-dependent epimerase/dehydratase family protein [Shinella sumterensis]
MALVTGASGFVGSHLVAEMTRRGLPAKGITRGAAPGLVTVPSYDPDRDWRECVQGIDTVVHLAARVHIMRETAADPLTLFRKANVEATENLARQAAEAGVRRFVFVSSIKVNGERTEPGKPFTADNPSNPQDPYGISKAEAEAALMALGRRTGMEITIVRPPLVYGPGVRGNFRSLMKWAASGVPSIFPLVKNKRSFIYVANLCDLLITVLDHPDAANRLFLASDGRDLSTHELLTRMTHAAGRRPRNISIPLPLLRGLGLLTGRQDLIARLTDSLQVDVTPTCHLLGWYPPVTVDDALKRCSDP